MLGQSQALFRSKKAPLFSTAQHKLSKERTPIDPELRKRQGFSDGLVRISVGIENPDDLIADLKQALEHA